ncbi:interleukin 17a/f3 [Stigmatopora argus]
MVLSLIPVVYTTNRANKDQSERKAGLKKRTVRLVAENGLHKSGDLMGLISDPYLANMSLSPWSYKVSKVASRLPRVILYAHCLTSACLSYPSGAEDSTLEVKPIKYQVLVLRRVPKQRRESNLKKKRMKFRLETETITVGCTCIRHSV